MYFLFVGSINSSINLILALMENTTILKLYKSLHAWSSALPKHLPAFFIRLTFSILAFTFSLSSMPFSPQTSGFTHHKFQSIIYRSINSHTSFLIVSLDFWFPNFITEMALGPLLPSARMRTQKYRCLSRNSSRCFYFRIRILLFRSCTSDSVGTLSPFKILFYSSRYWASLYGKLLPLRRNKA